MYTHSEPAPAHVPLARLHPVDTSALSMSIVDKEIVSFHPLGVPSSQFYREEKESLFDVKKQPTAGAIRPNSNVCVQF